MRDGHFFLFSDILKNLSADEFLNESVVAATHTKKTVLIKSEFLVYKRLFVVVENHFKEVLCSLDIQTEKPNCALLLQR